MGEQKHTKLPWMAATAYSSVCGVPIVNQEGRRIANTALPDMPKEWDELKRQSVIDAAFICTAVNTYPAVADLVEALEFIRDGYANQDVNHVDYRVRVYQVALDALSRFEKAGKGGAQ